MKISTRIRYALRAMIDLTQNPSNNPVPLTSIAQNQKLPLKYLENLFVSLRQANLVVAIRGIHGGYQLARSPENISVLDIFRAIEGDVVLVNCVRDHAEVCWHRNNCPTQPLWADLSLVLARRMAEISLRDLANGQTLGEPAHE